MMTVAKYIFYWFLGKFLNRGTFISVSSCIFVLKSVYDICMGCKSLSFLSDRFWLPHSIFPRSSSGETTTYFEGSTFTRPNFPYIFSRWPNHYKDTSKKHLLILFNFGLVPSSSSEVLSSSLTMHIL